MSEPDGVGAVGVPVSDGEANDAAPETSATVRVTAPVLPATDVTAPDPDVDGNCAAGTFPVESKLA